MIANLFRRRTNAASVPIIVCSEYSWNVRRLRTVLDRHDLFESIISGDLNLETIIATIPPQSLLAVVLDTNSGQGLASIQQALERISSLRKLHPSCAIIFMSSAKDGLDTRSLPPRCMAARNVEEVRHHLEVEASSHGDRNWSWRNSRLPLGSRSSGTTSRPIKNYRFPIPNFNVKHPAMLAPIALASARSGIELFCEISPREAFLFHGAENAHKPREMLYDAFCSLRQHADAVELALGGSLRLHLDHADDLDIIKIACDAGFDSIMADGSARSLSQNILFTQQADKVIRPYQCAIEGEVGCLDGKDSSKYSHTQLNDLKSFVKETSVDFVGVSVGQYHGFEYGFSPTRHFMENRCKNLQTATSRRHHAMAQAFSILDMELQQTGLTSSTFERRLHRQWATDFFHRQGVLSVEDFIEHCERRSNVRAASLLDRLIEIFSDTCCNAARERSGSWSNILTYKQNEGRKAAAINHSLLQDCRDAISGSRARLVIHGGSSIQYSDLRRFYHNDVARVNFGTTVFARFLDTLATQRAPARPLGDELYIGGDYRRLMAFLDETTASWRDWLADPPAFLDPLVDWITENMIVSLQSEWNTSEVLYAV